MEAIIAHYQECNLKEYQTQLEISNKNVAFVNSRFQALRTAHESIHVMIPGVMIYNISYRVFESANGRLQDEFFFDVMYPFQEVHFTVSFERLKYDRLKIVPFKKLNHLKCPLKKEDRSILKYVVGATAFEEIESIFVGYWGF